MQARKIRYDVIGLTETRKHRPLNATFDTGEELFLRTCDSSGVGGVGVLVNTNLVMNIDSFEQLTIRIGRLRLRRCGSIPAFAIFTDVGVAPKFYTVSDHRVLRARFFFSRKGEKAVKFKRRNPKPVINWDLFTSLAGFWEDAVVGNIDGEYDGLVQHLRDSAKSAEGLGVTKRQLSYETLELIRQRGAEEQ
ncbi:hypothetical protein ANCCAN_24695 [Ancylostoma caninum]|uniref:Endonuclease/exonuclease/phosphatase domain-containing protein n=1 Tax=Ancylostoma caninum TaxID=29170 RepID=A0A368FFE0_ANCCA|nr:hypothetical protein ANCCAN_24695 [Ancylostoma caninum]